MRAKKKVTFPFGFVPLFFDSCHQICQRPFCHPTDLSVYVCLFDTIPWPKIGKLVDVVPAFGLQGEGNNSNQTQHSKYFSALKRTQFENGP